MSAFFRTQQFFSSFVVVFERFVETLEVMPPRPIEIAVPQFGQIADGNKRADGVFLYQQGDVILFGPVCVNDDEV